MRNGKILALIISCAMLFTMSPVAEGFAQSETADIDTSDDTGIALFASQGWQPKPTRSVSGASSFPLTLKNGDILQINGPISYSATAGITPISVASGANAKIIINGSVTLKGANASGTTGATAAISVPENAKLTIYSAHDEELSTSKSAPKDSLTVTGGNAATGADGADALHNIRTYLTLGGWEADEHTWYSGSGGNGGGGAAAAIGGSGGNGGSGGSGEKSPALTTKSNVTATHSGSDDNPGKAGNDGKTGNAGSGAGTIYISGRLNLTASGGSAAAGGKGGAGSSGYANTTGEDDMVGGCGGGGGGGGGCAAKAIGAGGAGGAGGGSGGLLSSDHKGNVQGCGGGGGGGGWPNGGGGGGGGAECSKALDEKDNTSQGGDGGYGGSVNGSGGSGSSGTQTGTDGHGKGDANPGGGGSGASGLQGGNGSGGSGGKEKDDKYNGGKGGNGGSAVYLKAWHTAGSLIISTAANFNVNTYGDGGGKGTQTLLTPYVIYDLMDCNVTLSSNQYTYTGKQLKPTVQSVTYSPSTDRDGKVVPGYSFTVLNTQYSVSGYGENIHCPSGTITVEGKQNSNRTTVQTNGAAIGSKTETFTIKKATLMAPITLNPSSPYVNQSVTASLNRYSSSTAGTGQLSGVMRESTKKTEGPKTAWSLQNSSAGKVTETNGLNAKFSLTSASTSSIKVTLSDMNDFEDYTVSQSVTAKSLQSWTTTLSSDTPHPRIPVSVVLPTGVNSATYQWYAGSTAISGATAQSYTPTADDIGKVLSVVVTPSADTGYAQTRVTAENAVENHKYDSNGFCTVCDEYQPAVLSNGIYEISNGGQMFWFSSLVSGDRTHAVFTEKNSAVDAQLTGSVNLESREWKPIGGSGNNYTGSFDGQGYTISNLKITKTNSYTGLFGRTTGTIQNFTVEGKITLSGTGTRIGGAVGTAYGGKVSGVRSKVTISNQNFASAHIGGVVGGIDTPETAIEKCLFEGSLQIEASSDCIGGVVGYSNGGARIKYCANLGTVTVKTEDAYTGGILGYVNNSGPSVQNCYNYGKVQNGGGDHCGAIVGWLRTHTASKYTDNYYLAGSAPAPFGSGSNSTSAKVYAESETAFTNGKVCYLVNGRTSADDVIWRQDVDNGNTPYDSYPVFEGGIVYQNREYHDCTTKTYTYIYSNSVKSEEHINHNYVNGFCACCDALEPVEQVNGIYEISNGGKFFDFANKINSGEISQSSAAALTADIDLEGSVNGQPADYAGITKSRNFPGVGTSTRNYQGTFNGGGHTVSDLYISRENKTDTSLIGVGLFGYVKSASISGLTVNGSVSVHRETENGKIERIGGVVGAASGSKLYELFSYVNIEGVGELETPHVGGVSGDANDKSEMYKCMYFGNVDLESTLDCVGGVTGYINDSTVHYCANIGTVKSGKNGGYVGGVVGYLNNSYGVIRNCYNFGTVQNGGGSYCGGVVGRLRGCTDSNITDNYYLDSSAPYAFGSGSKSTTATAPAKTTAAFTSGEVCYLVNSKTSTGDSAIWKQNVDNGITPYDKYPVFDSAAVYFRSDNTYSNYPEAISVDISWGAMEFDYHSGRWNPDDHSYSGGWSPKSEGSDSLSVKNNSNVAINTELSFAADSALTQYNLSGSFNGVSSGVNRINSGAGISTKLTLRSLAPQNIRGMGNKKLGDITVRLTTIGGGN